MKNQETIERAYIELLASHDTVKITVQSICKLANVNRTTFYAHYADVLDLQKKIEEKLSIQLEEIFKEALSNKQNINDAFYEMFCFIKDHQVFYKLFLKYNNLSILKKILSNPEITTNNLNNSDYHISFFTAGVSEMIRIWLNNNCKEKPEELAQIIYDEYCRV